MLVWFGRRCRKEAEDHQILGRIEKWSDRLRSASYNDALNLLNSRRVGKYVRIKVDNQRFRVIGAEIDVNGEHVFVWLRAIHRNDGECQAFYDDAPTWGASHLDPILEEERPAIGRWVTNLRGGGEPSRPELPMSLYPWLAPPKIRPAADGDCTVFYESWLWVARFRDSKIQTYWQSYYDLLVSLIGDEDCGEPVGDYEAAFLVGDGRQHVLGVRLDTSAHNDAPRPILLVCPFLNRPTNAEVDDALCRVRESIGEFSAASSAGRRSPLDAIAACSRRCYPETVLYEKELWQAVVSDAEGNLALSAEELQILEAVERGVHDGLTLPLFLNGQAGSGKSTMLAHIFASYCFRKLTDDLDGDPLFLTLNEQLLERTRQSVLTLLTSNARYLEEGSLDDADIRSISGYFAPFRSYLRRLIALGASQGQLPDADTREPFDPRYHVTFNRFRRLYLGQVTPPDEEVRFVPRLREVQRVPPELAWFVIRSYIKGFVEIGDLTPEAYRALDRDDRTIPDDTYQLVYDTIWSRWYKGLTQDGPLWDDQDLVRTVLTDVDELPDHPVIFCDESQDFTPVELRLILRLSAIARYELPYGTSAIPFMFAGDPLQTVNPSGFRWESLRGTFHEAIKRSVDPDGKLEIRLNFEELTHNYRSLRPVVGLLNHIQAWRSVLFQLHHLRPQTAWSGEKGVVPTVYVIEHDAELSDVASFLQGAIIIVPAEEGGESAFVKADPWLSRLLTATGDVYQNVFTALSAKGLEFNQVVLYGFGNSAAPGLFELEACGECRPVDQEHYFNKLYVAASRARKRLIILDTPAGFDRVWSRFVSLSAELEERLRDPDQWRAEVGGVQRGTLASFTGEQEDDPRQVAEEIRDSGLRDQDPSMLRKARGWFIGLGDTHEARRCEAWALRFENQHREAGALFLDLGEPEEARKAFWEGSAWSELTRFYRAHRASPDDPGPFLARYLSRQRPTVSDLTALATDMRTWLRADNEPGLIAPQWAEMSRQLAKDIDRLQIKKVDQEALRALLEVLTTLRKQGLAAVASPLARCAYTLGEWEIARKEWEALEDTQHEAYWRSRAAITPEPDNIQWLARAQDHAEVVAVWLRHLDLQDTRLLGAVSVALERRKKWSDAIRVAVQIDDMDRAAKIFNNQRERIPTSDQAELSELLLRKALELGRWGDAVTFYKVRTDLPASQGERDVLIAWFAGSLLAHRPTADELGRSADRVDKLLQRELGDGTFNSPWLNPMQVGELLERYCSKIVVSLQHYERYLSDASFGDFARRRWLRVKRRQAAWTRDRRGHSKADPLEREVKRRADQWRINPESIPDFPTSTLDIETVLSWTARSERIHKPALTPPPGFRIIMGAGGHSARVLHEETGDRIDVDAVAFRVSGDGVEIEPAASSSILAFRSEPMGLAGELRRMAGGARLRLTLARGAYNYDLKC